MKTTFIDIREIFRQQHKIMKAESSNWFLFYIAPVLLGIVFSVLFYRDSDKVLDILTLFLSIFIPIFLSLLATMISFVMNKIKTRHNKERIALIKETFYNICYLIPTSLFLLLFITKEIIVANRLKNIGMNMDKNNVRISSTLSESL